jgi:hypothetical protein
MIIEVLPEAKSELMDAVAYYEGEQRGLGRRLGMKSTSMLHGLQKTMGYRVCGPAVTVG